MTSKLTRERIELIANFHRAMTLPPSHDEIEELARMALAAMDSEPVAESEQLAIENFRSAMEGIGHIRRTLEETFGGLHGTHVEPDVLMDCKTICDAIYAAYSGNSPVIPDGYVMVPREPTEEMNKAGWAAMNEHDAINPTYRAMIAAAPHETPALNSVQSVATVPGKWIPVSEQMPPSRHEVLVGRWWGEKPRWCCKWATYIPGHPDAQSSGWLIPGGSWTPTHWMELPAAPQEVK